MRTMPNPSLAAGSRVSGSKAQEGPTHQFEVFFDGACPLCKREVSFLRRRDAKRAILFTDIAAEGFDAAALGLDQSTLMAEIHGRLPNGQVIAGVEVFRHLYALVGFERLVAWSRFAPIDAVLDRAYGSFAKNRLRLTGRCHKTCMVEAHAPASEAS